MSKLLSIDEMLDVLQAIEHPEFDAIRQSVERLGDQMGEAIAAKLDVEAGAAHYEGTDFGGTCVAFFAKRIGQPCPGALQNFDSEEWTGPDGEDLDPSTGESLA